MSTRLETAVRRAGADRLAGLDMAGHNAEVKALWEAFHAHKATRVPIVLGINSRFWLLDDAVNALGMDFQTYSADPDAMFDASLFFARWNRFNLLQDMERGLPETWEIAPDFQNYYEAAWLGCPVEYCAGQVPDSRPVFADCPEKVMEKGVPDPFGGFFGKVKRYYEHFQARAGKETFCGRPIKAGVPWCGLGTDGALTGACNLFGPTFVCTAMIEEPERLRKLLEFITTAALARMTAWRKVAGVPVPTDGFGFADDSVALISTAMYREHILPHHRRLCAALATDKTRSIHLCGDATRHFKTLRDELNIQAFDTGFPVDFGVLRAELGPEVTIQGGPHVDFLLRATPGEVRARVREILGSGVRAGGRFVLREGNNLAPCTPLENVEAMYGAGREYGRCVN